MKTMKILIVLIALTGLFSVQGAKAQQSMVNPVVAVTGGVFNAVTHEPVTVFLVVLDETGKKVSATRSNSAENGYYYIPSLKPGRKYFVTINVPEYCKEKFEIDIANTTKYQEISKDFLVTPMVNGAQIPLSFPPYELNKSKLRVGAEDLLFDINSTLMNNPQIKFEIVSYPDNDVDKAKNKQLTEERSRTLANYFTSNGIDASRISSRGSETTDPKNPPPTTKKAKGKRYIGPTYIVIKQI